jgi:Arsenical resistance operon protein ArsD
MSRPLPLAAADQEPAPSLAKLAGSVEVFDPAMCCATGICGPGVDPALLALARDLRWVQAQGARVSRYGLSHEPQAFVANPRVQGLLQAFGDGALPAVLVNGGVLVHGRYPTREELVAALARDAAAPTGEAGASGCCAPGSGCC